MPFLRQRQQIFAEEGDLFDMNRQFAGARAEQISAHPDVVAQIEQFVQFETLLANRIFLHIDLQSLAALLQVGESRLAHQPDRHDPSGNAHIDARWFEFLRGLGRVVAQNLSGRVTEFVFVAIGGLAESLNLPSASRAANCKCVRRVPNGVLHTEC